MLAIPNFISFIFLLLAVYFARKGQIKKHKSMVLLTMVTSFVLVFMFVDMRLSGGSIVDKDRLAVFSTSIKIFLASHIIAATLTFLISLVVCSLGLREVKKKWHKKVAYFMLPIWAYSSITGVIVYFMVGSPK